METKQLHKQWVCMPVVEHQEPPEPEIPDKKYANTISIIIYTENYEIEIEID